MPDFGPDSQGYESWEKIPSTRSSLQPWSKNNPVDVTLATPGTAENLFLISPGLPTVNLVTNPSFETGAPPTGYTASGAALSQSAVIARNGSNSMLINPDNLTAGEGGFWLSPMLSAGRDSHMYFVVSAYFNDNAGSGDGARIIIADTNGVALATGNTITLAASWGRSIAALPLFNRDPAQYRVYFVTVLQHNTNFYVDSFQSEILEQNTPTAYCDGAQGINYEWQGTAHASISRRRKGIASIRGYRLHTTRDVYVAFDQTASSTTGEFVRAGTDFWEDTNIAIERNISILNVNPGEQPRVYGRLYGIHKEE